MLFPVNLLRPKPRRDLTRSTLPHTAQPGPGISPDNARRQSCHYGTDSDTLAQNCPQCQARRRAENPILVNRRTRWPRKMFLGGLRLKNWSDTVTSQNKKNAEKTLAAVAPSAAVEAPIYEELLEIEQAAAILKIGISATYELTRRRRAHPLPMHKVGRHPRFRRSEIERWVDGEDV
jgi:excisionase family DNA binding protein